MGLGEHVLGVNDRWCSPERVLAPLERCFGIDFDPCGNPGNVFARTTVMLREAVHPADKKRGTAEWIESYVDAPKVTPLWAPAVERTLLWGDGLRVDWSGRGFGYLNMPYSDIEPWLVKMKDIDEGVALLPARVNATYMHEHAFPVASAVCFPDQRIVFLGAETQPPWHSMLLYYGTRPVLFAAAMKDLGIVLPLAARGRAEFGGAIAKVAELARAA